MPFKTLSNHGKIEHCLNKVSKFLSIISSTKP